MKYEKTKVEIVNFKSMNFMAVSVWVDYTGNVGGGIHCGGFSCGAFTSGGGESGNFTCTSFNAGDYNGITTTGHGYKCKDITKK